ncbi:S8 family serine peptidase [Candidatus Pacearchaeota archaeon]|nr:S8 family serine peptidase [Candidatus Pacearchaeota archaeon]
MKSRPFFVVSLVVILLLTSVALVSSARDDGKNKRDNGEDKIRVVAHTDKEVSDALANGCKVVREARGLKALTCSQTVVSSLGLQEDIKVFAMDSNANKQIRADVVQSSGNNGQGRKVVILDTGYDYNHPELSSSYLGGKDFVNDDDDPFDGNGHGSHIAGIITADGIDPKAKGVAPAAGIISGKVLSDSGAGYFSDVVAAIYWAVDGPDGTFGTGDDFGADAISISLGTAPPYTYKGFCDGVLPSLTDAIKYAKDKGVLVVVASGNSGGAGASIPGCISYSTTIGAVDSRNRIASFSGTGNSVDLTAPGVNIYSSWIGNSSYAILSGTSMSTPMVSGVVALIKLAHPSYTAAQVENALFKTAKDLGKKGKDTSYGWGRVDAYSAVSFVL